MFSRVSQEAPSPAIPFVLRKFSLRVPKARYEFGGDPKFSEISVYKAYTILKRGPIILFEILDLRRFRRLPSFRNLEPKTALLLISLGRGCRE